MTMQETVFMSETDFRASKGKLNSRNRYLRADASGFAITAGPTIRLGFQTWVDQDGHINYALGWRYSVDGYVRQRVRSGFVIVTPPETAAPISFDAETIEVDA